MAACRWYHFHRVYRPLAGETPAETLSRLRLSRAAAEPLKTPLPLRRVARRAGFGSTAAFARASRTACGIPRGACREAGGIGFTIPEQDSMTDVTFAELPALRLAAIERRGPSDTMGATFDRLTAWAAARGLVTQEARFCGLYPDDPSSVPAAGLRSLAALSVPASVPGEGEVRMLDVPPPRLAALRDQAPCAEPEAVRDRLYGASLPGSGETPEDHPVMEEYLNACRAPPLAEWLTDIPLPIRRRLAAKGLPQFVPSRHARLPQCSGTRLAEARKA